jgi:hypothetical protein
MRKSNFCFELNHERIAFQSDFEQENPPNRTSLTLEVKIKGIAIGYTGRYIVYDYSSGEDSMYQNLVYQNSVRKPRIDNTFNFALRSARGHSLGGSISFSQVVVDEPGLIYNDDNELSTSTKYQGLSFNYGYAY